jgi:alpha-tubulin suppressor-like RCC1 family protein
MPGATRFTTLAVGGDHTCGLTADGAAWCWGRGRDGELGDGASGDRAIPVRARGDERFAALALGERHSCGLTTDGRVVCWGLQERE